MGLFDIFKRKNNNPISQVNTNSKSSIERINVSSNLNSQEISLKKKTLNLRKEKFEVCLSKKNFENIVAKVAIVLDKSGSMSWLYNNGTVQEVVERVLPIGIKFDDNATLDVWTFNEYAERMDEVTENDFYNYVNKKILTKTDIRGGTCYAPVIKDIVEKYTKEEPSKIPAYIIFITDGDNFDNDSTTRAIVEASKCNIFFQFIGIGEEDFKYLKKLDEMEGRFLDNANFFEANNISRFKDEELYDKLMSEFPSWYHLAKEKGLV